MSVTKLPLSSLCTARLPRPLMGWPLPVSPQDDKVVTTLPETGAVFYLGHHGQGSKLTDLAKPTTPFTVRPFARHAWATQWDRQERDHLLSSNLSTRHSSSPGCGEVRLSGHTHITLLLLGPLPLPLPLPRPTASKFGLFHLIG